MKLLCLIVFLFGTKNITYAFAQQACSNVSLASKMGPIRNQRETKWCESFALADLLSFEVGERVSAHDLSLNYYETMVKRLRTQIEKKEEPTEFYVRKLEKIQVTDGISSEDAINATIQKVVSVAKAALLPKVHRATSIL